MRTIIIQPNPQTPAPTGEHCCADDVHFMSQQLATAGHHVTLLDVDESLSDKLRFYHRRSPVQVIDMTGGNGGANAPSLVLSLCHQFNIPYVGNSAVPHALLAHWHRCAPLLAQAGVPVLDSWLITERDVGRAVGIMSTHASDAFELACLSNDEISTTSVSKYDIFHSHIKPGHTYRLTPIKNGQRLRQAFVPGLALPALTDEGEAATISAQTGIDALVRQAVQILGVDGPAQFDFVDTDEGVIMTGASTHAVLKENGPLFQATRFGQCTNRAVITSVLNTAKSAARPRSSAQAYAHQ